MKRCNRQPLQMKELSTKLRSNANCRRRCGRNMQRQGWNHKLDQPALYNLYTTAQKMIYDCDKGTSLSPIERISVCSIHHVRFRYNQANCTCVCSGFSLLEYVQSDLISDGRLRGWRGGVESNGGDVFRPLVSIVLGTNMSLLQFFSPI